MDRTSMDEEAEFKLFYKQEEALEYIATAGPQFRIFSREKKVGGSRVHHVYPSIQHFQEAYERYEDSYKTFYEVIPVGHPAKLYFDLEFPKELNPDSDGDEMVKIFLAEVEAALLMDFPSMTSSDLTDIVYLDASTPAKFSQHIIYPKVIFRNLFHEKIFIERLFTKITNFLDNNRNTKEPTGEERALPKLLINTGREIDLFVDKSVYGKKQNFRIFQSRKFGKNNPLLAKRPEKNEKRAEKTDQEILLLSLITNTDSVDSSKFLEFSNEVFENFHRFFGFRKSQKNSLLSGRGLSPFPQLDRFVENIVSGGVETESRISKWEFQSDKKTIRFFIDGKFRFCENIRKNHENKNVFFIFELRTGVYWLRCLDPACGTYRPEKRKLPEDILPTQDEIS